MRTRDAQLSLFLLGIAVLALAAATPVGVGAQQPTARRKTAPPDIQAVAGAWSLERSDAKRQCRVTLDVEQAGPGWRVRFPAGCRRALPLLNEVDAWLLIAPEQVGFIDKSGKVLLRFTATGTVDRMEARATTGDSYRMERQERLARTSRGPVLGTPPQMNIDPRRVPLPGTVPGAYLVDRLQTRDTCRLVLADQPSAEGKGLKQVSLSEPCSDTGLKTFSPVGWRYEDGRLWLVARRGHELTLVAERDGVWRKDPPSGALLTLRRVPGRP